MRSTSIVIPVFNRAHLVHRAIDSAVEQTVPCEVVLVDHGSTDGIADVVARYGNRIRYIRRELDRGCIHCWRDGVEQATGEFVHLTYDDDWIQPSFIERCQPLLHDDVAFVYTQATLRDPHDKPLEVLNSDHPAGIRPIGDLVDQLLRMPLGISPGCVLLRRSDALSNLIPTVPGADGSGAGMDLLLLLLTSLSYSKYGHVREPLADFLSHPGSITIGAGLSGKIDRLIAEYSAAKAYYLHQPGARRQSPLREKVSRAKWRRLCYPTRDRDGGALYFSPHLPWPPGHGAHQRILQTLRWMADRYGPVHLVVGRQSNDNGRRAMPPRELVRRLTFLDLEPSLPEQLVQRVGFRSITDRTTRSARATFGRLLAREKPKVVFVNYVWWGRLVPRDRDFSAIIDTHDVISHNEHLQQLLGRLARQHDDPFAPFERDPPRLDRTVEGCEQELRTLDAFDLALAISRADQVFLAGELRNAKVVKVGYYPPSTGAVPPVRHFDRVRGLCPTGQGPNLFNEIGLRALDREFDRLGRDGVFVTLTGARYPGSTLRVGHWCDDRGLVRDYAHELTRHQFGVMVPFAGTGSQTKQYEFARAGVPVVGYRSRIDGELFTNGVDAVIVDRPDQMCRAIVRLADDHDYLTQLTAAARELPQRLCDLQAREETALQTLVPEVHARNR